MRKFVGWVERSDTHQLRFMGAMMGFAALYPSYVPSTNRSLQHTKPIGRAQLLQ
jgi:hypothetical protein